MYTISRGILDSRRGEIETLLWVPIESLFSGAKCVGR